MSARFALLVRDGAIDHSEWMRHVFRNQRGIADTRVDTNLPRGRFDMSRDTPTRSGIHHWKWPIEPRLR